MITRRTLIVRAALGFGAYALRLEGDPAATAAPPPSPTRSPRSGMSAVQYATLRAACERLLPRDDDPGANDLGVHVYLDGAITDPGLAPLRPWLIAILDGLDAEALQRARRPFAVLEAASQDELLRAWQRGDDAHRYAFDVLLMLTLEGAFGDPRHGGNAGGRGFAMVGA